MVSAVNQTPSFKDEQMKHDRVFEAYKQKSASVFTKLRSIGVQKERLELLIRGFKFEEDLEVWAKNKDALTVMCLEELAGADVSMNVRWEGSPDVVVATVLESEFSLPTRRDMTKKRARSLT